MKRTYFLYVLLFTAGLFSCGKEWLDAQSDKALVVPSSLRDFRELLDNASGVMNNNYALLGEIGADNYYLRASTWQAASLTNRNAYVWAKDVFGGRTELSWNAAYKRVLYCNTVLQGLEDLKSTSAQQDEWKELKGTALFFRAHTFYDLAQLYAPVYSEPTAGSALGIPLRLTSSINQRSGRASLKETYERIVSDLTQAAPLLSTASAYKTRPTRQAAMGLLARVHLSMQDYEKAYQAADAALQLNPALLDYNLLDLIGANPFLPMNEEIEFYAQLSYSSILASTNYRVDSMLVRSYAANDLRRKAFFSRRPDGTHTFIGSYSGALHFGGIARDELYLIRAECLARKGQVLEAMNDLNTLLKNRMERVSFVPLSAGSAEEALRVILTERRKELLFRGLRWTDLRRLNLDGRFAVTLKRNLNGTSYELVPQDKRYVYPIPDDVINASGMQQNER
ncbi:RagB/SusD family nutrient uptake outer membrane protein [Solitalea lacus]|uniref:RagB/SusD family nutrient uptake outer membrane protein n=1 Tax=Solitalea lacus TaxID=2911172 RepID=UPI001EDB0AB8|nr:RagB/SusD family nutrient uptake outer membrane protein [Solitalea lacus]UKJ09214.1 RagB/SusD family nutrient uptake outer membrane protein [Solitalea lacus]